MPRLHDVCRHVRSKNAGPYWVTVDLFFQDQDTYRCHKDDPAICPQTFARLFAADEAFVKVVHVDSLAVVKVSYPRPKPQGWRGERDMHGGQQYVSLLDVELSGEEIIRELKR